jgi:hypothetical protein
MGMFDSINQPVSQGNGGSFAQKTAPAAMDAYQQMQQRKANPVMRGRPNMGQGMRPIGDGMRPNPMTGARPAMGMRPGMNGPRPSQLPSNIPLKPAQGLAPSQLPSNPSAGIPNLVPPGDTPPPTPQVDPRAAAEEQMRGYAGPDLGSQDPRELARMGQTQLYGTTNGIGPSPEGMTNLMEVGQPMMPAPVQMDENGLEPRRGPR